MYLTLLNTLGGPRWALEGRLLPVGFRLQGALAVRRQELGRLLSDLPTEATGNGRLAAPLGADMEVWAGGVTYQRSCEARRFESQNGEIYDRVYGAERPELFFKAIGWRVVGHRASIRVRGDSSWNVPEPELVLVVNAHGEIVGYSAGNDVSSRSIEAENPLYLPQAKIYTGACALGPGLRVLTDDDLSRIPICMEIERSGRVVFLGKTTTAAFSRPLEQLVEYLFRELHFPHGVLLMTGTGIVPPNDFSLANGDLVKVHVGDLCLHNEVCACTAEI